MHLPTRLSRRTRLFAVLATAALATAGAVVTATPGSAVVAPTADYRMQGNLTTSVGTAAPLTTIGAGNSFFSTTVDSTSNRKVLKYPIGGGLALNSAIGPLTASAYTIVLLYKPLDVSAPYHRIIDLNGGVGDTGVYERGGMVSAYPNATSTTAPITSTAFSQVVLTRTPGKVVTAYVNGAKVLSFTDTSNAWLATNAVRFGKDNTSAGSTGEETGGQFARIRLYSSALTPADVNALDRLPSASADAGVTYVDAPDPVLHGGFLAYTANVISNGPSTATAVSVSLTIPPGTAFQGASPSRGTCAAPVAGKVTCTLGDMTLAATAQVLLVLKAPAATGTISSTATVSTTGADSATSNDSATQSTTVR